MHGLLGKFDYISSLVTNYQLFSRVHFVFCTNMHTSAVMFNGWESSVAMGKSEGRSENRELKKMRQVE